MFLSRKFSPYPMLTISPIFSLNLSCHRSYSDHLKPVLNMRSFFSLHWKFTTRKTTGPRKQLVDLDFKGFHGRTLNG